jgi:hypothetical protein
MTENKEGKMKKRPMMSLAVAVCLIFGGLLVAQTKEDIDVHKECKYCGLCTR